MRDPTTRGESATRRLLGRVGRRLRVAGAGRVGFVALLALAGLYAALFAASRLLALIPDWFDPLSVVMVPVAALLVALALHRRPATEEAARRIDRHANTKDLFLTATLLERSPGAFKPIVV
ncbi:MAG: hypothetical protein ACODAJ_13905, partial [Planctomycetota bacterium]